MRETCWTSVHSPALALSQCLQPSRWRKMTKTNRNTERNLTEGADTILPFGVQSTEERAQEHGRIKRGRKMSHDERVPDARRARVSKLRLCSHYTACAWDRIVIARMKGSNDQNSGCINLRFRGLIRWWPCRTIESGRFKVTLGGGSCSMTAGHRIYVRFLLATLSSMRRKWKFRTFTLSWPAVR